LEDFLKTASPDDVNVRLPRSGNSPLHEACIEREEQLLNTLLKYPDINVNLTNEDANSPLHYFCEKWTSPDYLTSFNLFFNRKEKPEVNAINSNGETPIFKAIFNPSIRALLMEALIKQNANLAITTKTGETLLHYAVHLNRADLVRLILQNRPSLDGNKGGATPEGLANELNGSQNIKTYLQQVSELFKWLEVNDLAEYKGIFVKNEITVELLPDISESFLMQMGFTAVGVRMKITKACEKQKEIAKHQKEQQRPNKEELPDQIIDHLQEHLTGEGIIDGQAIEYTKHLGTGAAGDVYKALYQGSVIAVKVLSAKSQEKEVEEFRREFEILRAVRNPYVVKFIGVAMKPVLCMVMEFCARGSLHHVLKDVGADINWARAISFCKETALGLKALHDNQPQIIHRDLKSPNLLVTQEWHMKIADFGLSRFVTAENMQTMKQMRGTYQYTDPAVYNGGTFSTASDIYSMGVIYWEIIFRTLYGSYQQPYSEFRNLTFDFQVMVQSAKEDLRPTIPANCPPLFRNLIASCWHKSQEERPPMDAILETMTAIEKEYKANTQEWDALRKI
jgi:tRNA A-37 threonylcarbamoyl transferase component Bud32